MSTFHDIAPYYDLIYADKDYAAEAAYMQGLLRRSSVRDGSSLLELGCGTGRHAAEFAKLGYSVIGVDASDDMLAEARERAGTAAGRLHFSQADLRTLRLDRQFDAVLACFHVLNYQTSDEDLAAAFATAAAHLNPGGVFLFDSWHGPAVLAQRPEVRVKEAGDEQREVVRIAQPQLDIQANTVEVIYRYFVRPRQAPLWQLHTERHRVRYLFPPDVRVRCERVGLKVTREEEWMTAASPGPGTWSVCYVGRR